MTDEIAPTPSNQGCLAMLASTSLAALLLTLGVIPAMTFSIPLYLVVFVVTAIVVTVVGLPLYGLALHFKLIGLRSALAGGAITGALLPTMAALGDPTGIAWRAAAVYALIGGVAGIAFFLTANAFRNPARNAALLIALAGTSAAATPFMRVLLTPAPSSAVR